VRALASVAGRAARAARLVAGDDRIPRPLRWLAAVGLLPLPGPFDEAVLLLAAVPLALFYRPVLADAWRRAGAAQRALRVARTQGYRPDELVHPIQRLA